MCAIVIVFPGLVTDFLPRHVAGNPSTIEQEMPAPAPDEGAPAQIDIN
jgi:hypothetical protein